MMESFDAFLESLAKLALHLGASDAKIMGNFRLVEKTDELRTGCQRLAARNNRYGLFGLLALHGRHDHYDAHEKPERLHNTNNDKGVGAYCVHHKPHETGEKADPEASIIGCL